MPAMIVRFPSGGPLACDLGVACGPDHLRFPQWHVVKIVWLNLPLGQHVNAAEDVATRDLRINGALNATDEALIDADLRRDPSLGSVLQFPPFTQLHRTPPFGSVSGYDTPSYFVNGHDERKGADYAALAYIFVMHPGNRIREIRKAAGLTQAELGERTGFGQDRISNYENGRRPLRLNELRVLARELTCAPADLLDDSDNPERLSGEERRLLQAFRDSSQDAKSFLLASAQAVSTRQDAA